MATSGTYAYNPSLGELTLYAFNLCGIRNTALLQEHMESARMAANMLLGRWSSQGVNLWCVDLQSIPLVQGTATYSVPSNTIVMLDAYVVQNTGGAAINRLILPISRSEYASYPNPNQQGFPTTYWFDRLLSPTVTLWPVPDGNEVSFDYYRVRQIQDSEFQNGQQVEIPYYFVEAFAFGLAQRLAMVWAPEKVAILKPLADESYDIASRQNIETAQQYISPMVSSYFRP
ncbi:MAG: hypothetical protein QM523_00240 [Candidatus Pacebacteria bacterium]|nr:hypothetical protein [Candidatus Paceibacterota bacterium]